MQLSAFRVCIIILNNIFKRELTNNFQINQESNITEIIEYNSEKLENP